MENVGRIIFERKSSDCILYTSFKGIERVVNSLKSDL